MTPCWKNGREKDVNVWLFALIFVLKEMQAKLAAQKLAERLNIKMQSYNPEGETSRKYREVRDEDDQSSDDEFWRWAVESSP